MKNILTSLTLLLTLTAASQKDITRRVVDMYGYNPATGGFSIVTVYDNGISDTSIIYTGVYVKKRKGTWSIHAGLSTSYFSGTSRYSGINLAGNGITCGIDYRTHGKWFIQPGLSYVQFGCRNPDENKRQFSTYNLQLSIPVGLSAGQWEIAAGPYLQRLLFARNRDFSGSNFHWGSAWPFYRTYTAGFRGSLSYDFIGLIGRVTYINGLSDVRRGEPADTRLRGLHDRGILIEACIKL